MHAYIIETVADCDTGNGGDNCLDLVPNIGDCATTIVSS